MSNRTPALVESAARHLVPTYRPRALVLDRGAGSRVWDIEGREYVDFAAGIAVSALGHGDPDLLEALHAQAQKLWHTSNVFLTEPPLRLAEELIASGVQQDGAGLQGVETATTVVTDGDRKTLHDGPFAETREHLGGYYVVDVPDLDAALAIARRIPGVDGTKVEVRPLILHDQ